MIDSRQIDPTKPLPVNEAEKQENNRNPSWFKPGKSGNPHGRPLKGYSITEAFKEMLGSNPEKKEELVHKIMDLALKGDMTAAKMIWQYMDGMPQQSTDFTSQGGKLTEPKYIILDRRPTQ